MILRDLLFLSLVASGSWVQANTVVVATNSGEALADIALAFIYELPNAPLALSGGSFDGAANSSGAFTNGPWNMTGGALLTTGLVIDATLHGNQSTNNNFNGSEQCGSDSFDASTLAMSVVVGEGYSGLTATLAFVSNDPRDVMVVLVDDIPIAKLNLCDCGDSLELDASTPQTSTGYLEGPTIDYDDSLDLSDTVPFFVINLFALINFYRESEGVIKFIAAYFNQDLLDRVQLRVNFYDNKEYAFEQHNTYEDTLRRPIIIRYHKTKLAVQLLVVYLYSRFIYNTECERLAIDVHPSSDLGTNFIFLPKKHVVEPIRNIQRNFDRDRPWSLFHKYNSVITIFCIHNTISSLHDRTPSQLTIEHRFSPTAERNSDLLYRQSNWAVFNNVYYFVIYQHSGRYDRLKSESDTVGTIQLVIRDLVCFLRPECLDTGIR
ncbi:hypothetical protein M406DRAFT_75293 [Cryphonectria parasitica EP155]|uniref:Uncharacterized protein n=1 Tax=Cryphonectria parasitica (strain ATCC 38755 / EP155) TaxID=660469 RepID=A0A9P4XS65_CRYP1|nr:uncharacterized protein M406DRAFT_75293 [Cryphonectria parasitica EP155]KAF3759912.1 hypothetical protein M406DRAFT_75293 [Cryphonectria parasitica EP155]